MDSIVPVSEASHSSGVRADYTETDFSAHRQTCETESAPPGMSYVSPDPMNNGKDNGKVDKSQKVRKL